MSVVVPQREPFQLHPTRVSGFVFCNRTNLQCLGGGKITGLSVCPRKKERITIEGQGGNLDTETDPQEVEDLGRILEIIQIDP